MYPRVKIIGKNYLLATIRYFSVIPGISRPTSGRGYSNKAMNSRTPNIDYRAIDGGTWWLRDNAYIQPVEQWSYTMMAIVITRLTSMSNAFTTFAVQNDDPKRWAVEKIQIYAKTNTWILDKQNPKKKKMELNQKCEVKHKAKARYVRIKVPYPTVSNTDVITKIHVTVNELNTKECTIAVDSVKRFCPDDESINLAQKGTILKTKFGIDVRSSCARLNYLAVIKMIQEDALDEVHEFVRWYTTGNNADLFQDKSGEALLEAISTGDAPSYASSYISSLQTGKHPNA